MLRSSTPVYCDLYSAMAVFRYFGVRSRSSSAGSDAGGGEPRPEVGDDEKSLVRRLDIFLMTFGCISQGECTRRGSTPGSLSLTTIRGNKVIKYLDQQNIKNAYVSGMKEDLHLHGNELNLWVVNVPHGKMID